MGVGVKSTNLSCLNSEPTVEGPATVDVILFRNRGPF